MKKIALIVLTALLFASCEQVDELTQFDMSYETSFTIPGTIGLDVPVDLQTPEIPTNYQEKFSGESTQKDLVEEIVLKEMELSVQNPSDGSFSFLSGLTIYIDAEGMEETKIAWKDPIPDTSGNNLSLETAPVDLKQYVFADHFNLRIQSTTDELIEQDHEIQVNTVFRVDAKILGQ